MPTALKEKQDGLRFLLEPLSRMYAFLMWARRALYTAELLPRWTPPCPTVSVGNIGWGGSGKTPLAGWLLAWAAQRTVSAVLLTRGYRAKPLRYPHLVTAESLPEEAGDEPLLLARENPQARVLVDPSRRRAGELAARKFKPEMIVLDDGFQHLAVKRDVDLVLLTPQDLHAGWNLVIPAGTWREPEGALTAAGAFLIKAAPDEFKALRKLADQRLVVFERPVFSFSLAPLGLKRVNREERAGDFESKPYLLVSGVGDPEQVERTARSYLGYGPKRHLAYPDHHFFTKEDALEIEGLAAQVRCPYVLCTPKDAVKLGELAGDSFWTLDVQVEFGPTLYSAEPFPAWWELRWQGLRAHYRRLREEAEAKAAAQGGKKG